MSGESITINGLAVEHEPGEGRPLIMIHGAGAGAWCWEEWLPRFAAAGFDCYAINLRGHPPSPPVPHLGRVCLSDYAADVEGVMATLSQPPVLLGHSMGGAIAQLIAARQVVAAMVLIASAPLAGVKYKTEGVSFWGVMHALKSIPAMMAKKPLRPGYRVMRRAVLNGVEPQRQRALFERFVPESSAVGIEILRGEVGADLSGVDVPKLVIGCSEDRTSPVPMQREIARMQGGEFAELQGYAHLPMLESGHDAAAQRILDWLREKAPASE